MSKQSALGWYIHYRAANYKKYGISQSTKIDTKAELIRIASAQRASIIKQAQITNGKANASDKDIELLERFLNESKRFLGTSTSSSAESVKQRVEEQALRNITSGLAKVDWATLKVSSDLQDQLGVGHVLDTKKLEHTAIGLSKALQKINSLEKIVEKKLNSQQGIDPDVLVQIKSLQRAYQQASSIILTGLGPEGKKATKKEKQVSKDSISSMRLELIELIKQYAPYLPVSKAQGDLFEFMLKEIPNYAEEVAKKSMDKELQDFVKKINSVKHTGASPESASINMSLFEREYFNKGKLTEEQKRQRRAGKNAITDLQAHFSSNSFSDAKTDIEIQYSGNTIFSLSLKSYDLSKANFLKLVEGTPLLFMLQDQDLNFVNHYLNAYSSHEEGGVGSFIRDARRLLKTELQLTLAYKALTGQNFGRTAASFIVLNDVSSASSDSIKVYRISDLMEKIEKSLDARSGPLSITDSNGHSLEKMPTYKNTWVGKRGQASGFEAEQRIINILKQAYDRKLSIKLKIATINGQSIHTYVK